LVHRRPASRLGAHDCTGSSARGAGHALDTSGRPSLSDDRRTFKRRIAARIPVLGAMLERLERDQASRVSELEHRLGALQHADSVLRELQGTPWRPWQNLGVPPPDSVDLAPWTHPFLTRDAIHRFRARSERVWDFALEHARGRPPVDAAFAVNMAQNMYKWARLAQEHGARATLYLHPQDSYVMSQPRWEEFDGEHVALSDGPGFVELHAELPVAVPTRVVPMNDLGLLQAWEAFGRGDRRPLVHLLGDCLGIRHEPALAHEAVFPFFRWARALADHDVTYIASNPIAAYLSGRPYLAFMVGGDLQLDCGRGDSFGEVMTLAYNAARFIVLSNPHGLAHCRRHGFRNGVYLPYPMDDHRYSPGPGRARAEWEARFGPGVYILSTARIDAAWKGNSTSLLATLEHVTRARADARFVFLAWGADADRMRAEIEARGLSRQILFLPPVGKRRLIDYYRSCDVVLDQLHMGYYGTTALEAAAVGRPVVMKIRREQYEPLYGGDVAPVLDVGAPDELRGALLRLIDDRGHREETGRSLREWLVRTHGARRTVPLMLALLRLAADRVPLPPGLDDPLRDPESDAELEYHARCRRGQVNGSVSRVAGSGPVTGRSG
jgi:glycosyltransferase involved in cell wall biosynthesis